MPEMKFAETHEWIIAEGDTGTCGITDFAQHQLTDIVFVELPPVGKKVAKGERAAVVESVKSVSDIYAPVSGEITEVNTALSDSPEFVNQDATGKGWIFKMKLSNKSELSRLMTKDAYDKSTAGGQS